MSDPKPSLNDLRIERDQRPGRGSGAWVIGVLFILLALAGGAFWWTRGGRGLPVRTAVAQASAGGPVERTVLNASGYVTARRKATVSSKVTGKVVEVLIEEGMKVHAGQVLARLDATNVKASLALTEAQLDSARKALAETRVRLTEAEQELQRQTDLVHDRIATQADYDHAEAAVLALKARLEQQSADVTVAERQVASWQQQLDDTIIRAPFAGVVTSKDAQPGEMISPVSAGSGFTRTGICTIVDMQSLEIEVDVNESYINRVEDGQPVEAVLDAYPEWKIPCKVIAIIPTADRQKSTVKVRVAFEKLDPRVLPDMSIKVAFREDEANGTSGAARCVLIPKAAVRQQDGRDLVMVVANGRAERRAVTVASQAGQDALLSAGLAAGEKVVLDWPDGLKDGATVVERQ